MLHPTFHPARPVCSQSHSVALRLLLAVALCGSIQQAIAQSTFNSTSDGSDGDYTPTVSGNFDPTTFTHGTGDAKNVFNFGKVTIPRDVTITFTGNLDNAPIYILATGDVDIEGSLNLNGSNGADGTTDVGIRLPAPPGSGGYGGGIGGITSSATQFAGNGNGPGGGVAGICGTKGATVSSFAGNQFLVPLFGGSGGGGLSDGASGRFGPCGGAGGGAILIASSTQIIVSGSVNANGGVAGESFCDIDASGGSGGAIRLVSNTISGFGYLSAAGSAGGRNPGGTGRVRLEANNLNFNGQVIGNQNQSNPLALFVPAVPPPSVQVTSINGTAITEHPFTFPDITLNTASSVPIVITAHQIPVGTLPILYVFSETSDQQGLPCTGGLVGTLDTSTCTMSIVYPFGGSRGFVKATWTGQ